MKKICSIFLLSICFIFTHISCTENSSNSTENTTNSTENTTNSTENTTNKSTTSSATTSSTIQTLLPPSNGLIRGISFNMDKKAVSDTEKAHFVKDTDTNGLLYDIDLNENEFVDLNYEFNENGTLKQIKIDAYLKSLQDANVFYADLKKHLNANYSSFGDLWEGKDGEQDFKVTLKLLDNPNDTGVTILWESK